MSNKILEKRFPATVTLDFTTFLNDKKVDGELYALFQEYSYADDQKRTIVNRKSLPTQVQMCEKLGIKSPKTLREHRNYLIKQGFIVEEEDHYVLPNAEEIFIKIPLETLQFLNDTLKEQVIKIYIYLSQRWKYKGTEFYFTKEDIANHIGLDVNNRRTYTIIENVLQCLSLLGLLTYESVYQINPTTGKSVPRMHLTSHSFQVKKIEG